MTENLVAVKFGNGVKTHAGHYVTYGDRDILFVGCGSRVAGTQKRVIGDLEREAYFKSADACDKCAARYSAEEAN